MIFTILAIEPAAISARELTYILVKSGVGTGRLVTTIDENNINQYFFIGIDDEVIQLAGSTYINPDLYSGIPVSLLRPSWATTIIEAAEAASGAL